jgi:hypothetical protein
MKITGLDDKIYSWNPITNIDFSGENTSSFHIKSRKLLQKLYPTDRILEEVSLSGTKPILFADFLLPLRKMIVEVHGPQHYEWINYFHATKKDFLRAKANDENKKRWCQINKFYYVELPYFEDINAWRERITNASIEET